MPGADELRRQPLGVHAAANDVGQGAGHEAERDADREDAGGKDEQHRHEDELRRDRRARPDLEVDARGQRVRGNQQRVDERRRAADRAGLRKGEGDGDEAAGADERRRPVAAAQAADDAFAPFLDELFELDRPFSDRRSHVTSHRHRGPRA